MLCKYSNAIKGYIWKWWCFNIEIIFSKFHYLCVIWISEKSKFRVVAKNCKWFLEINWWIISLILFLYRLAKWDDYCLCAGAVINELTQALACSVILVDKIQVFFIWTSKFNKSFFTMKMQFKVTTNLFL